MEEKPRAPGLRFDVDRPMWRASKAAVKAGYPVKVVNLSSLASDQRLLRERCIRLQREMDEWMSNGNRELVRFDGTFRSLLDVYQTDPESSYFKLKPSSRHPYDIFIRMLRTEIGQCHIDMTDGRDLKKWFTFWIQPTAKDGPRHVAKGNMAISIIKAAAKFGVMCRLPGVSEFREVLKACSFEGVRPRTAVITADEVVAARAAAHANGHPALALCYAIQFEAGLRQWDVRGQWVPLSDPRPSAVIRKGEKWLGPTWAHVDGNLILRVKPTKTEDSTGQQIVVDFRVAPMIMEEIAHVKRDARTGPLIMHRQSGFPYRDDLFEDQWRKAAKAAGIDDDVWNRDLRASATTEARAAGAKIDDVQKMVGHAPGSPITAQVYDRAAIEAHRRIAKARNVGRKKAAKNKPKT
jgi:Phage integrase family